jgi:hypothetical protein
MPHPAGEEIMSYSEFMLTVIALILFWQLLFRTSDAKAEKRHKELLAQIEQAQEALKEATEESTQQITGRRFYTDFLSQEVGYQWPRWREHLNDESETQKEKSRNYLHHLAMISLWSCHIRTLPSASLPGAASLRALQGCGS